MTLSEAKEAVKKAAVFNIKERVSRNISLEEVVAKAWGLLPQTRSDAIESELNTLLSELQTFRQDVDAAQNGQQLRTVLNSYVGSARDRQNIKDLVDENI